MQISLISAEGGEKSNVPKPVGFLGCSSEGTGRLGGFFLPFILQSLEFLLGNFGRVRCCGGFITSLCKKIPQLIRRRRGVVWGAGWLLAVVGTTGIDEREALEARQMGGREGPLAGATHTS